MYDNANSSDRQALLQALQQAGLEPDLHTAEDGAERVVVPLLDASMVPVQVRALNPEVAAYVQAAANDWRYPAFLYLSTAPKEGCIMGVFGRKGDTGEHFVAEHCQPSGSQEEMVEAFQSLWDERDSLLSDFIGQVQ